MLVIAEILYQPLITSMVHSDQTGFIKEGALLRICYVQQRSSSVVINAMSQQFVLK